MTYCMVGILYWCILILNRTSLHLTLVLKRTVPWAEYHFKLFVTLHRNSKIGNVVQMNGLRAKQITKGILLGNLFKPIAKRMLKRIPGNTIIIMVRIARILNFSKHWYLKLSLSSDSCEYKSAVQFTDYGRPERK